MYDYFNNLRNLNPFFFSTPIIATCIFNSTKLNDCKPSRDENMSIERDERVNSILVTHFHDMKNTQTDEYDANEKEKHNCVTSIIKYI